MLSRSTITNKLAKTSKSVVSTQIKRWLLCSSVLSASANGAWVRRFVRVAVSGEPNGWEPFSVARISFML